MQQNLESISGNLLCTLKNEDIIQLNDTLRCQNPQTLE